MASIFQTNEITQAGLALIASATSSNPITYVKGLSASQVPQDPEVASNYNGIVGEIDASAATDNVARVVALYGNNVADQPQDVKAIAIMGKLANQTDSQAVIFAYCYDADSQIKFPASSAPAQRTRFAFNFAFDQVENVSVTEAGSASLADLNRLVSCHKAGNPYAGEDQTVLGEKTFQDTIITHDIIPESHDPCSGGYIIGNANRRYEMCYVSTGIFVDLLSNSAEVRGGALRITESNGQEGATFFYSVDDDKVIVDKGLGTTEYPLKSVCTQELILRTEANADYNASIMYGDGGIMMHADIMPAHDTRATAESCGRYQRPWNKVYVRDTITFVMADTEEAQCIKLYEDEGTLVLSGGHDLQLGSEWGKHGSIFGAPMGVCSVMHSPSTLPNSSSHADAPTWDIEKGTIVMAMPCWATARSVFMNRKGAGDLVTVEFPNVALAPFQHGNSYDSDPEKGAWHIASWKCGAGSGAKSGFIPLSTLDGSTDRELFSYLPAGTYRLLSSVEECTSVGYDDYHPEGMCVLLQKIL